MVDLYSSIKVLHRIKDLIHSTDEQSWSNFNMDLAREHDELLTEIHDVCNKFLHVQKKHTTLLYAARKVVKAFPSEIPSNQDEVSFNVPAYIIQELADAAGMNKE